MHAMQRYMPVGQAAFGASAVFEMQHHLQLASITAASYSSVSMQTQEEMSDDSQPHAHADRQEGRERGKHREGKREKGSRRGEEI